MEEILQALNLLPESVLFIDDDPAERAQMLAAFPKIRSFGGNPYLWRRILLLAPETQVPNITKESSSRTEMAAGQMRRDSERSTMSVEEFARQQNIRVKLYSLSSTSSLGFARALELINKTNQFNTTGKRWSQEECHQFFRDGGVFFLYDVEDRYTAYGMVGVVFVLNATIVQWVMSCRVIGLRIEQAVMRALVAWLRRKGAMKICAVFENASANLACREFFSTAGFTLGADKLILAELDQPKAVDFIKVEEQLSQLESLVHECDVREVITSDQQYKSST